MDYGRAESSQLVHITFYRYFFFMVKAFKISLKISSPLCIINYDHHSYIVAILNSPLQSVILYTYQHLTCRCSASL